MSDAAGSTVPDPLAIHHRMVVVRVCAGMVAFIGLIALVGWAADIPSLKSVMPGMITMKVNTALGLISLAAALWGLTRHVGTWRFATSACLTLVVAGAAMTLSEYVFGWDLKIDNVIFLDRESPRFPGRNAPATNMAFLGIAAAFYLLHLRRGVTVGQVLLLVVAAAPLATLGGYLYQAPSMYTNAPYPVIALNTSIALMVLCVGGLLCVGDDGVMGVVMSRSLAGALSRKLLPLAAAVPLLTGLLTLVGQRMNLYSGAFGSALLVACSAVFFAASVLWSGVLLFEAERERANVEKVLHGTEELVRAIVEHAPAVIYVRDRDGKFLVSNARHQQLVGSERHAACLPGPSEATAQAAEQAVLDSHHPQEVEETLCRPDGEHTYLSVKFPIVGNSGQVVAVGNISTDITDRKRAEDEILRLNQTLEQKVADRTAELSQRTTQLEQMNEEAEEFTYTVSHDLRAPLRSMQGFAQALEEDYRASLDDTARDYLARIVAGAGKMERLIQDLLSFSRLSREDMPLHPCSLQEAVSEALLRVTAEIEQKGATMQVAPDLPQVQGNDTTLVQVLQNLLTNALKFVAAEKAPRIAISSASEGSRVVVSVRDNGIGIAPQHVKRIFNVFERLHSADKFPGTGIGLAIVRKGVERMGGTVGVESGEQGSRFWIDLPAATPRGERTNGDRSRSYVDREADDEHSSGGRSISHSTSTGEASPGATARA